MGVSTPLWAGPPFETDDPEPPPLGHWEIYLGTTGYESQGNFLGWGPFLELNYGVFPDTQLSLTEQAAFNWLAGGRSYYGYGDTLVGLKYRFLHETDRWPQAAFYPQVYLPTGDASKDLGTGQFQFLIPLWLQKSWGPWTTYGGGAYWITPGPGYKNWTFVGWELQRDLSDFFTVGGELFFHSADVVGVTDGAGFNLGGFLNFDDINHIVFSAGRDILGNEYQFTGYLAYQWTFPKE